MSDFRPSWFIWGIYSFIGTVLGTVVGICLSIAPMQPDLRRFYWRGYWRVYLNELLGRPDTFTFTLGSALLGAGIVSCFGERLLFGRSTLAFSNTPAHNIFSRSLSVAIGTFGGMTILYACFFT